MLALDIKGKGNRQSACRNDNRIHMAKLADKSQQLAVNNSDFLHTRYAPVVFCSFLNLLPLLLSAFLPVHRISLQQVRRQEMRSQPLLPTPSCRE